MGYVDAVRVSGNLKSIFLFFTVTHVNSTTNLHIKDVVLKESDMPLCCHVCAFIVNFTAYLTGSADQAIFFTDFVFSAATC